MKRAMLGAAAVALVVRGLRLTEAAGLLGAAHADPQLSAHILDSAFYDEMARRILSEGFFGSEPYLMAPLYGWFLALVYRAEDLLGGPLGAALPVYGLQVLMGVGTAALAAWLGGRLSPRLPVLAAWVAGLLVAFDPISAVYDARLLSVSLTTLLLTGATALLLVAWEGAWWRALVAGVVLGLAATGRANLLLAVPVLVVALASRRRYASTAALVVGFCLPLAVSAGHNLVAGAGPVPVSVNGGVNLYRGNNELFIEDAVHSFRLPAKKDALARKARLIASMEVAGERVAAAKAAGAEIPIPTGELLSWREADSWWTAKAMAEWKRDPLRYFGLALRKTHQLLGWRDIGDNTDLDELRTDSRVLRWLPPLFGGIAALALVGLAVQPRPRKDVPAVVLLLVGIISVALFFVVSRYRLPLLPLLAAYAASAVASGVAAWRDGRRKHVAVGGLAAVGLGGLLAVSPTARWLPSSLLAEGTDGPDPWPACAVDEHMLRDPDVEQSYRLAKHQLLSGELEAAEKSLRGLLLVDPGHTPAAVDLSYLLMERGEVREAGLWAARVLDRDVCDDKAWSNLGVALLRQNQPGNAAEAFAKATQLDPYEPSYVASLAEAKAMAGDIKAAKALLVEALRWAPELWSARAVLARIDIKSGDYDGAIEQLDAAVASQPDRADLRALRGLARLAKGEMNAARAELHAAEAAGMGADPSLETLRSAIRLSGGQAQSPE